MQLISKSKKRYYYHRKLKKAGVDYSARENTIYVPMGTEEADLTKDVKHLREHFGYSVTFKIS